ncbi:PDZ domain-containing protein [Flavobacterium sp. TP390]|uniref:PDZ domain-containing protein n=1 Tax=Flavobacterium profundi TaxID=1774945 RepID=A0A6I4IVW4_9FLAO|nr:PDZ domain-containing protein [Flavobacterium profundi]MVO11119.1 PDZ domain-containing protein [Flavobacterium profundi]
MFRKLLHLLILYFIANYLPCQGQNKWKSSKDKIVIPFELTHNLIIVNVKINNVKLNMLLDTGSDKNLLFSFPENDSIIFYETRKVKINGLGKGESLEAYVSNNNHMEVKGYSDDKFQILLITDQNINLVNKLGLPINGIIGASFFQDYLVEINYQKKNIYLHKDSKKNLSRKASKYIEKEVIIVGDKPYFDVFAKVNKGIKKKYRLLVDTGLGDGLWLFENDTIKCNKVFIKDILGRGLGGDIEGKKARVEALDLNGFILNEALVAYPDSIAFNQLDITKGRNGSLGGQIMKRFNWFLDYKNKKFYFKKNKYFDEPFNYNMSGIEVQHTGLTWVPEKVGISNENSSYANSLKNSSSSRNTLIFDEHTEIKYNYKLKPIFEIYAIRPESPAAAAGLKVGDIIHSINGKKAFDYTIQKITDLFQSEEGKVIKIEVQRNGQLIDFKFKLQKII